MLTSYIYNRLPLVILAKVKNNFCGGLAILKINSLAFQRQELDSNLLKSLLFDWYVKNFIKYLCKWNDARS